LLGRLLSYAVAGALLVLALTFSLLVFAVLALAGLLVWGWLWWKMRALRRQAASGAGPAEAWSADERRPPADGYVIEGEVVRVSEENESDASDKFRNGTER